MCLYICVYFTYTHTKSKRKNVLSEQLLTRFINENSDFAIYIKYISDMRLLYKKLNCFKQSLTYMNSGFSNTFLTRLIGFSNISVFINHIINTVKSFLDEFDDIGNADHRSIFSNAVIADKEHIYFVIGNSNMKLPLKPKLLFKSAVEYKVRLTMFATCFGILILR